MHPYLASVLAGALALGCHVSSQVETVRAGELTRTRRAGVAPRPRQPTIVVTDHGMLRFVEPLECAMDELVAQHSDLEHRREPNLAAFIVGVVATAVGGVVLTSGAFGDDPSGDPLVYAGGLGLALGLPLAIGPWIGTSSELAPGRPLPPLRRAGSPEPCGERGITARTATLGINGTDVRGTVDAEGVFSVSPYQLIDAFRPTGLKPWDITAALETAAGPRTLTAILEGPVLAKHAAAFLARAEFDTHVEPIRLVPGLSPGLLRVSLTSTSDGPAVRIVLAIQNTGPGPAWALRGQLASPLRALDGRMMYFGAVARGEVVSREVLVPISADVATAIRNATILVSLELRDAHGTAPATPVRFNGAILTDAPR